MLRKHSRLGLKCAAVANELLLSLPPLCAFAATVTCVQAVVHVDEFGTEAAAATAAVTLKSAFDPKSPKSLVRQRLQSSSTNFVLG
jgi:hypothetical protein